MEESDVFKMKDDDDDDEGSNRFVHRYNYPLNDIDNWFLANKLNLSLNKCLYTIFNPGNRKLLPTDYDLSVSDIQEPNQSSILEYL